MSTEPTDQMIYAFAGEPEITATEAHYINQGLARVLKIVHAEHAEEMGRAVRKAYENGQRDLLALQEMGF